jgi:hypothetical protein
MILNHHHLLDDDLENAVTSGTVAVHGMAGH